MGPPFLSFTYAFCSCLPLACTTTHLFIPSVVKKITNLLVLSWFYKFLMLCEAWRVVCHCRRYFRSWKRAMKARSQWTSRTRLAPCAEWHAVSLNPVLSRPQPTSLTGTSALFCVIKQFQHFFILWITNLGVL